MDDNDESGSIARLSMVSGSYKDFVSFVERTMSIGPGARGDGEVEARL